MPRLDAHEKALVLNRFCSVRTKALMVHSSGVKFVYEWTPTYFPLEMALPVTSGLPIQSIKIGLAM